MVEMVEDDLMREEVQNILCSGIEHGSCRRDELRGYVHGMIRDNGGQITKGVSRCVEIMVEHYFSDSDSEDESSSD